MTLRGDDEIDSLLDMMGSSSGSGHTSTTKSTATTPFANNSHETNAPSTEKDRKRKKKKRKDKSKKSSYKSKGTKNNEERNKDCSFADTRLSQSCFQWPCTKNKQRWLCLGRGLLYGCKQYTCSDDEDEGNNEGYGSSVCESCGNPAATHELCFSNFWMKGVDVATAQDSPPAIISIAKILLESRNVRCILGEFHATSTLGTKSKSSQIHQTKINTSNEVSKNSILPPLNSICISGEKILNVLDYYRGRMLSCLKKMKALMLRMNRPPSQIGYNRLFNVSISENDVQLLQEKVTALINAVQGYKEAVETCGSSHTNQSTTNGKAGINQVEKRLAAIASCDAVYYRCYYAAIVAYNSSNTISGRSDDVAAMIPHPPTYFSCPGLAWDVQRAGMESLRVFLGESNNNKLDHLAAPLDDSTRRLLESWGLNERLSAAARCTRSTIGNPLLTLWQSRFMETTRHLWSTGYSAVKSPLTLRDSPNRTRDANGVQVVHNNSQESLHETEALSPAVAQWRDSVRDYPANFYAYAAPTTEALTAISNCLRSSESNGQILEAGAGTGYWSSLLKSCLKHNEKTCDMEKKDGKAHSNLPLVLPYDIAPPSSATHEGGNGRATSDTLSNEYHGNIPTFMDVHKATTLSEAISSSATTLNMALLLCYPPPGSNMAQKALSAHISNGGDTVVHIGEWQGLTGDSTFETLLTQNFSCWKNDVLPLPLWSTDATYLTIWRGKGSEKNNSSQAAENKSFSPALGFCVVKQCFNRAIKRCRYARCLQYCSLECFRSHFSERKAVLALHMINSPNAPDDEILKYENDKHFLDLSDTAFVDSSERSCERPRKKRKKKRR